MDLSGVQASYCHPAALRLGAPGGMPPTSAASVLLVNWLPGYLSSKNIPFSWPGMARHCQELPSLPDLPHPLLSRVSGGCDCYVRGRRAVAREPSNHSSDKPPGLLWLSLPFTEPSSGWSFLPEAVPRAQVELPCLQLRAQRTEHSEGDGTQS
uniref:Uncharacterized protein n=1 Tax=Pipistrellus kuhlii TaxID=59472 RepID=A0A7J7XVR1_PIPKU|nr:hypothetical protein mPipKuh1_010422 [Pipistrellus kuhlii]